MLGIGRPSRYPRVTIWMQDQLSEGTMQIARRFEYAKSCEQAAVRNEWNRRVPYSTHPGWKHRKLFTSILCVGLSHEAQKSVNYVEFDVLRSFWKQKKFCDIASGWSSYSNENTKGQSTMPRNRRVTGFRVRELYIRGITACSPLIILSLYVWWPDLSHRSLVERIVNILSETRTLKL